MYNVLFWGSSLGCPFWTIWCSNSFQTLVTSMWFKKVCYTPALSSFKPDLYLEGLVKLNRAEQNHQNCELWDLFKWNSFYFFQTVHEQACFFIRRVNQRFLDIFWSHFLSVITWHTEICQYHWLVWFPEVWPHHSESQWEVLSQIQSLYMVNCVLRV